jgi:hypothetical protein
MKMWRPLPVITNLGYENSFLAYSYFLYLEMKKGGL